MIPVTFIQFLRPYGTPKKIWIDCPDEIAQKAEHLKTQCCHFAIEVLADGIVSATIERDGPDGETIVLSHVLSSNGPEIPAAVERLIERATERLQEPS